MSKRPELYVVASAVAPGKVVTLRRTPRKPMPVDATARETAWRDLVRRLTRNPVRS